MSRDRSRWSGNLILLALLALVIFLVVIGVIPLPR